MTARTKNTKTAPAYRCTECGWTTAKWVGRCGECQTWGTVEEAAGGTRARTRAASSVQKPAQPIAEVDVFLLYRFPVTSVLYFQVFR